MVGKIPSHRPQGPDNQHPHHKIGKVRDAKRMLQGRKVSELNSHQERLNLNVSVVGKSSTTHKHHKAKQLSTAKFQNIENFVIRSVFPHLR